MKHIAYSINLSHYSCCTSAQICSSGRHSTAATQSCIRKRIMVWELKHYQNSSDSHTCTQRTTLLNKILRRDKITRIHILQWLNISLGEIKLLRQKKKAKKQEKRGRDKKNPTKSGMHLKFNSSRLFISCPCTSPSTPDGAFSSVLIQWDLLLKPVMPEVTWLIQVKFLPIS